jgi:hypothetical protein
MVLVNSCFHTGNNLTENHPQFQHVTSKIFASNVLSRKNLKEYPFEKGINFVALLECQNISLSGGATHISRAGLYMGYKETCLQRNHEVPEILFKEVYLCLTQALLLKKKIRIM